MEYSFITTSKDQTVLFGEQLAKFVYPSLVITLTGDLGAGKTTLVSGLAKGMGIKDKVTSPTFNIVKCYFHSPLSLFHIDAYRLEDANKDIGLEEFIEGEGVCIIEWPNFIEDIIPTERLNISLINLGDDQRKITVSSSVSRLNHLFEEIKK